jgi:hypothetical protein
VAQPTERAQNRVQLASGCSGHLEGRGLSRVVAEAVHLVLFDDHALARFELGLRAGQMRDEATVETLENLGDTMRVRSDRASRCSVLSATTRTPPVSAEVSRNLIASPVAVFVTVRFVGLMVPN